MLGPFYSSEVLPPFLAEQASQTCWASLSDLLNKPLRLAGQASHACRTSFLKRDGQVWAFVLTGGPCERMGPTFFGRVDVGILDSPMGPLDLPGLISQFTLFTMHENLNVFPLMYRVFFFVFFAELCVASFYNINDCFWRNRSKSFFLLVIFLLFFKGTWVGYPLIADFAVVQFGIILLPTVRVNFGVTMTYYNLFILMTLTWNLEGCSSSKFQGLLTQSHGHDYLLKIRYRHKFHIEQLLGMVTVVRRRSAFFNFKGSHESTNLWL